MRPLRASELRIRRKAEPLVANQKRAPINLSTIATRLGAGSQSMTLKSDIDGLLLHESDAPILVANSRHPPERQRLAVARLIGHLVMHGKTPIRVLQGLEVNLADPWAGDADTLENVEATIFAMHLLLPGHIAGELAANVVDFANDKRIARVAAKFGVTVPVLCLRLLTFGDSLRQKAE